MITKPFVTIWIIARNEANNIWRTLEYLIEQTYGKDSFEILVIDWNSTDKTIEVAENILKNFSTPRLVFKFFITVNITNLLVLLQKLYEPQHS